MTNLEFIEYIQKNKVNKEILTRLQESKISDLWLVSGSLFQTVWNIQTGREPEYGIKDYDLFYFDDSDLSWDAENEVIKSIAEIFSDIDADIEIKNQARVHLWYPKKFQIDYPPLKRSTDGIDRFLAKASQVGIKLGKEQEIYSPSGFGDLSEMIIRPNRVNNFKREPYLDKCQRWKSKWPELTMIEIQ